MSKPIVEVKGVSKRYRLGVIGATRLRDDLEHLWNRVTGKAERPDNKEFWALKDVSFDVQPGEVVGIIGRNGAGKSTLLKILSRITDPTSGEVVLRGRIASLLEVGTGFHPDLSGRDNIFLNGAILGMKKSEIARKFDEIVDFAELAQFIDTPVKRYSSGMYVRLAFAVAAHLEPEILIIDEVLAVGDTAFQSKCLGKMEDVSRHGRTILFVSHHMPSVNRLCQKAILLEGGSIAQYGDVLAVTSSYLSTQTGLVPEKKWTNSEAAPGDASVRLSAIRILQGEKVQNSVDIRYPVTLEIDYWNLKPNASLLAGMALYNDQGTMLFMSADFSDEKWAQHRERGLYRSKCIVPGNFLGEGSVRVLCEISTRQPTYEIHILEHDVVAFQVVDKGEPGSVRANWGRPIPGLVRPKLDWHTEMIRS